MQFSVGVIIGLMVGVGILFVSRRRDEAQKRTVWLVWVPLLMGLAAVALTAGGMLIRNPEAANPVTRFGVAPLTIALSFAALVSGVGLLVRGPRSWQVWTSAIIGALPGLFWVWFAAGELLYPH